MFDQVHEDAYQIATGLKASGERHELEQLQFGVARAACEIREEIPTCPCGRVFSLDLLDRRSNQDHVTCVECGYQLQLHPVTLKTVELLGAFHFSVEAFIEAPPVERSAPALQLKCSSCGADISSDGASRILHCPFCDATETLTEAAWERMHPRPDKRPLYFLFRPDPKLLQKRYEQDPRPEVAIPVLAKRLQKERWITRFILVTIAAVVGLICWAAAPRSNSHSSAAQPQGHARDPEGS